MLDNSNLYNSEWLAIVFSKRNKNYGAFVLRSQSSQNLFKSFLIVAPIFTLFFIAPLIYSQFKSETVVEPKTVMVTRDVDVIHDLRKEEPKKEEPKKELPKPTPVIEQAKTVKMTSNIVVTEKAVTDEPIKTADLENAVVGSVTQSGKEATGNGSAVVPTNGVVGGTGEAVDNSVYSASGVEKYPEFPGGMAAWAKFIQKNLKYPYMAQETGIQGKVFLSFVVEKDGSITDVAIVKGIGGGCDEEALRVIKKSPKWNAGEQNDTKVRVRYNMPINYTLN